MIRIVGIQDRRPGGSVVKVRDVVVLIFFIFSTYFQALSRWEMLFWIFIFFQLIEIFQAVGSPASNLHTLDLEADLQRQPVTQRQRLANTKYKTQTKTRKDNWCVETLQYLDNTKISRNPKNDHDPRLWPVPHENRTWARYQTYHNRWTRDHWCE